MDTLAETRPERADTRFTMGLIDDVLGVLERHGYKCPDGTDGDRATGAAVGALSGLVRAFEGDQR